MRKVVKLLYRLKERIQRGKDDVRYANVIRTIGDDECQICCYIFDNLQAVEVHKEKIKNDTKTLEFVETISFKCRKSIPTRRFD